MGLISKLGRWLDTRFPEKISAEEVYKSLTMYEGVRVDLEFTKAELKNIFQKLSAFEIGARSFDKDITAIKDKINTMETVIKMRPTSSVALNGKEAWKR